MQVIPCSLLLLVLGASGETDGCADTTSLLQRSVTPHSDTACPCIMGDWGDWGDCSATCGGGSRIRSRAVKKEATNGGKCDEDKEDKETCNVDACPKDCVVSEWLEWSCSVTCGEGTKTRTRILEAPAEHGGNEEKCKPLLEEDDCKLDPCPPEPCEWDDWSDWGHCSTSCGGGQKNRDRKVKKIAKHGGETCEESDQVGKKPCATDPCPIDCKVTSWSEWSDCNGECCDGKCGKGTQTRKRSIIQEAQFGGKKCPDDLFDEQDCDTGIPCPTPCVWDDWSQWSGCSVTCGRGDRTRNREVSVEAQYGGKECNGTTKETIPCEKDECPVPCDYSWEDWSPCSRTCGGGVRTRKIDIKSEPKHGGAPCPQAPESEPCSTSPECECKWGEWEDWTPCSKTCGTGTKTHTRKAISEPKYGLEKCNEDEGKDTISCQVIPYCPQNCEVGDWGDWSKCEECGPGHSRSRTREVIESPKHGGLKCPPLTDTADCPPPIRPCPSNCTWDDWSDWSDCDTTCDKGTQKRTREVDEEAKHGGAKCPGNSTETRPCPEYIHCPIDCEMGDWDEWSTCPRTCGGGEQKRQRPVKRDAAYGGEPCGPELDTKECATAPCPHCCYTEWSDWACIDDQKQSRTRTVDEDWKDENNISHECTETKETRNWVDCGGQVDPNNVDVEVCGYVKDASNHEKKLEGAQVTSADGKTATTKEDGKFCLTLPAGEVTLTAEKKGYVTEKVVREVVDGDSTINDIEMSTVLEQGQWRIVMAWEKKPWDLDSWTMFGKGTTAEQNFFYYYAGAGGWDAEQCDRNCASQAPKGCVMNWIYKKNAVAKPTKVQEPKTCSTSSVTAFMDQDNKNITIHQYAETTTLSGVDGTTCGDDCNIHFCVYQYAPRPTPNQIRESGATVEVYNGDGGKSKKVGHFTMGKDGIVKDLNDKAEGTSFAGASQWFVFSIDAKTNEVTTCTDLTSDCAKMPCGQHYSR